MMIQSKTNNHLYGLHSFAFSLTSYGKHSTKDNVRKNKLFLQNEPKFQKVKLNVNKVLTRDYENKANWTLDENEPKTNPIKANSKPIKAKTKPIKAKTKPIKANKMPKQTQTQKGQNERNWCFNKGI